MPRHRSHSIEFKRQVAQEFVTGETLHGLAKRHDISRNLIRVWVAKFEAGAFDEDAQAADGTRDRRAAARRCRAPRFLQRTQPVRPLPPSPSGRRGLVDSGR